MTLSPHSGPLHAEEADVVVVGGGPAGLSTALFLCHADPALRGRIVVLEREQYPRDKFCAGGIGARADQALARIGVSVDVPSVYVTGASLALRDGEVALRAGEIGRVVRRLEYDHALARVAAARGARIHENARVTAIAVDPCGVTVESTAGRFRARILVGADGVGSFVRRALGLSAGAWRAQVVELDTEGAPGDPPRDLLHFDAADRSLTGYAWDFPTLVDGEPLVCRGIYHLRVDDRALDIRALLAARLAAKGLDIERYRLKRYAERGFAPHEPFATQRVVLVGEAAGIDALTGEGIAQAIAYGAFAGPYLAEKLATGDLSFSDFAARFARSQGGVELRVRARIVPHFFGADRDRVERFLLATPSFLALGLQHFGGQRISRVELARSAWSAARHAFATR